MRDTKRERERGRDTGRERNRPHPRSPMWVGLDLGTLGLRPGPKAGVQPLSHPGVPKLLSFFTQPML